MNNRTCSRLLDSRAFGELRMRLLQNCDKCFDDTTGFLSSLVDIISKEMEGRQQQRLEEVDNRKAEMPTLLVTRILKKEVAAADDSDSDDSATDEEGAETTTEIGQENENSDHAETPAPSAETNYLYIAATGEGKYITPFFHTTLLLDQVFSLLSGAKTSTSMPRIGTRGSGQLLRSS